MQRQTTDLIKIQPKHWYLRTYCKPNDEILYIHAKSYHPENTFKKLTTSVETRIFNLSSNPDIFIEASKDYKNILNQSGQDYKLQCKLPNNENEGKNRPKIAKETSSSTRLFQRTSPTALINISFF